MAAPNIVNITSLVPHTVYVTPADTARNALVVSPSIGTAFKINQIIVSNIDGTNPYAATVELRLADGTTYVSIGSTISVPANASLIMVDKTTMLYLLDVSATGEPNTIWVTSSTADKLTFTCSYEAIS
jgi:hypothetical protein